MFCSRSHFELTITVWGRFHHYLHFTVETEAWTGEVTSPCHTTSKRSRAGLFNCDVCGPCTGRRGCRVHCSRARLLEPVQGPLRSLCGAHGGDYLAVPSAGVWPFLALVLLAFLSVSFSLWRWVNKNSCLTGWFWGLNELISAEYLEGYIWYQMSTT